MAKNDQSIGESCPIFSLTNISLTGAMNGSETQNVNAYILLSSGSRKKGSIMRTSIANETASRMSDIVFANSEEARFLLDNYDAYECCKSLGKLCPIAIVKNGKKGSYISCDKTIYEIPLYGTDTPVDTTGAGDTYAAGFLYGFLKGYDIETTGKIASYLAGEIISQIGAQFDENKIKTIKETIKDIVNGKA